jgi:hypothetical protein
MDPICTVADCACPDCFAKPGETHSRSCVRNPGSAAYMTTLRDAAMTADYAATSAASCVTGAADVSSFKADARQDPVRFGIDFSAQPAAVSLGVAGRGATDYQRRAEEACAEVVQALFPKALTGTVGGITAGGQCFTIADAIREREEQAARQRPRIDRFPLVGAQVPPASRSARAFDLITGKVADLCQSNRRRFWAELAALVEAEWDCPPGYDRTAWAMEHASLTLVEAAYERVVGVE